jgi:hypothetical protein
MLFGRMAAVDSDYSRFGSSAGKNAAVEDFVRYAAFSAHVNGAVFLAAAE